MKIINKMYILCNLYFKYC